jgi:hypothetical protein
MPDCDFKSRNLQSNYASMTTQEISNLRSNILKGIEISFNKLLIKTQKEDGELVVSKNGRVVRVKARKLKIVKH